MDFTNIELFFNLYFHLPSDMAFMCLSCLVQLSAIRRSFFNNTERMKYLNELCTGVKKILETSVVSKSIFNTGLNDKTYSKINS